MFSLGMIVVMMWAQSLKGWNDEGFRITVLLSLGANLVVGILSGTRRRLASGRLLGWLGQLAKLVLWLACQAAEVSTTSAIGSLSLCGFQPSDEEKQVAAFWATFLLLHLGGPDNLTAYAMEDNKISSRKFIEIVANILVVIYTISTNTHRGSRSWSFLLAASIFMLLAGTVRYIEKGLALWKADLDNMEEDASSSNKVDFKSKMDRIRSAKRRGRRWLCDREALLLAQDLFPIWRHALVDSSVDPKSPRQVASEMILSSESDERGWTWECMCKVAEMELSLIYDFLYTKAILAHSWCYYLIRFLSPLSTAAAAFLFSLWLQQHQQGVRRSFVRITYTLLIATLLMDVAWLLRALGSTWAYAYFLEPAPAWLCHEALHASRRWWRILHRLVHPFSNRRWSGTIGRYNLLNECTATTASCCIQCLLEWLPWSMAGDERPKEMRYLDKIPPSVKEVLFERVKVILQQAITKKEDSEEKRKKEGENEKEKQVFEELKKKLYTRQDIRTYWGHKALSCAVAQGKIHWPPKGKDSITAEVGPQGDDSSKTLLEIKNDSSNTVFGDEFEEDVLRWHIATCMVLPHRQAGKHARAIEVLSEYMMFLVAVRRQMLPGLVLHSQLLETRKALHKIWYWYKCTGMHLTPQDPMMNNKEKLAMALRYLKAVDENTEIQATDFRSKGTEGTEILDQAVKLYFYLSGDKLPSNEEEKSAAWLRPPVVPDKRLELIFNVWVDKLVYAAVRCSREAHAKQLSAGGDLTTVVWMLIQHAGPFCIGLVPDIMVSLPMATSPPKDYPPPPEKKKKKKKKAPTTAEIPPPRLPPPMAPGLHPPAPPYCPMCPPCYHPSYPPVCPDPYYAPSWPPVCPWCAQYPPQHEEPADDPEQAREDEHEDSSSSSEDEESEE